MWMAQGPGVGGSTAYVCRLPCAQKLTTPYVIVPVVNVYGAEATVSMPAYLIITNGLVCCIGQVRKGITRDETAAFTLDQDSCRKLDPELEYLEHTRKHSMCKVFCLLHLLYSKKQHPRAFPLRPSLTSAAAPQVVGYWRAGYGASQSRLYALRFELAGNFRLCLAAAGKTIGRPI